MRLSELVRSVADHCQQQVEGRHVLAISDSSEINLQSHAGRLKAQGLGVVGNNRDVGFFIHPTLVVDGESGFPLGLSSVQLWSRALDHADKHQRNYQKLPPIAEGILQVVGIGRTKSTLLERRRRSNGDPHW